MAAMNKLRLKSKLVSFSHAMFQKDFFGIYHGSVSAKSDQKRFIINTKESVFDQMATDELIELYFHKDYRWKEASIDADIHLNIYLQISDAKFVTFSMPPYATAFSLKNDRIEPLDYFGHAEFGAVPVYDPKSFDKWYERAATEIPYYFLNAETNLMVIRGYGVFAYNRDLHAMVRQLSILENSARFLTISRIGPCEKSVIM